MSRTRPEFVGNAEALLDLSVDLGLVVIVVAHRRMNLSEREVWVVLSHLLGGRSVGHLVHDQVYHLHACAGDPRDPEVVNCNMAVHRSRRHYNSKLVRRPDYTLFSNRMRQGSKRLSEPTDAEKSAAEFIAGWQSSGSAERANYQPLCDLVGVPGQAPAIR